MIKEIKQYKADSLSSYFQIIETYLKESELKNYTIYFRGESKDFGVEALKPSIYRNNLINNEDNIYREVSRYNDIDFSEDKTTFDRLCRMQHYSAPTRLIDLSDDPLTSLWFAINEKCSEGIVYLLKMNTEKIKYADSDTVTLISNLSKLKIIDHESAKSKFQIAKDVYEAITDLTDITEFNDSDSVKFLLHEIRNDINHFSPIINPNHISSIQCVKPRLTNSRIKIQKGAFLLFGLNIEDSKQNFPLINKKNDQFVLNQSIYHSHPIEEIVKIDVSKIDSSILSKIGVIMPSIYPEMDKVSEYFKNKYLE